MSDPLTHRSPDQLLDHAAVISRRFGLGPALAFTGPHARGYQAEVFKLQTTSGSWAVKRSFSPVDEADLQLGAQFQDAARSAGVATPRIMRDLDGHVLGQVDCGQVRVDEWVDLAEADSSIDPAEVGAAVATLHRVTTGSIATEPCSLCTVAPDVLWADDDPRRRRRVDRAR